MDERRARIHDDLRGILGGELLFEPIERAPYSHDASLYEIDPLGVVVPRTSEDLVALVHYAVENQIPLHPRGAGTGLAGETLGPGLVIDFSRHFRRIIEIGKDHVEIQPGVVLDLLNDQLAPLGRRIGPDPSHSESRTIGGMVGLDAAGIRSLRHGTTADHVRGLSVVFSNGEAAKIGFEPWPSPEDEPKSFKDLVVRKLGTIYRRHVDLLTRLHPRSSRNRAGYALGEAASPVGIDLARLLVGSEGTLALVTGISLATVPTPTAQSVVVLPFGRIGDAARAVVDCLRFGPSACELFDWRSLSMARDVLPTIRHWIAESAEAALIVEIDGDDPAEVADRLRSMVLRVEGRGLLVSDPVEATGRSDCDFLLGLRKSITPGLMRMKGPCRPVPFIEDIAVPPEALAEFLRRLQDILKQFEASWTVYAHAGAGQLHVRPFLDLGEPSDVAKLEPMASAVHEAALSLGGSISGEHGCGLARTQFLRRQAGDLFHAFREIKDAFDPYNVLNPGKVVGDDPHLMTRHLKPVAPPGSPEMLPGSSSEPTEAEVQVIIPALRHLDLSVLEQASACNGCGACRTQEPGLRMCPTFRALRSEAASPRNQANLLRQIATGALDPRLWGSEEMKANADLCIHCMSCRNECPAGIDVSSLMVEAKAAYVEIHGLAPTDWYLSRVDLWSKLASRVPITWNGIIKNRFARWLIERTFGVARQRALPNAHRTPFLRRAERLGLTRARPQEPGPRVAYFVDVFANHFDQELAESVVGVLRQAGVNVHVPRRQRGSGMSALVAGDLEHARELALANLRVLGDVVRDGYTVVCSEPTATLMIRREYLKLTDDLDASLVAENTMDVGQYLSGLAARGQLPEPKHPLRARVGYHQPCHLRTLEVGTPGLDLIRSIPELDVEFIDRGCSGMAGTFGLSRQNFRTSLRAGRALRNRLLGQDIEIGSTECGSCRMQMEQGSTKRTLHPIKLLGLSYGLNPSLLRHFRDSKPRREMS
ncbi:FAD-binding and (Fe-S)-binding domain-containing protein [Tundrisphaera lichenicola]|uniref:FAD-binding and (Fe-S)-binding domain-containing protein n=1 Tax=Tundrisphaera lichenicola TaxID=2029860 RepID=UPI003EBF5CBF